MMALGPWRIHPCQNCGKLSGYYMKRGRGPWIRICRACDLKYDVKVKRKRKEQGNDG